MTSATSGTTVGEWLDGVLAQAPPDLAVRIRRALPEDWRGAPISEGAELLSRAATRELGALLETGCDTRYAAPGLLVVDALVTHACQLLAVTGKDIDAETSGTVDRIARLMPAGDGKA